MSKTGKYREPMRWKQEKYIADELLSFLSEVVLAIPEDCDPMEDLARVREKAVDLINEAEERKKANERI